MGWWNYRNSGKNGKGSINCFLHIPMNIWGQSSMYWPSTSASFISIFRMCCNKFNILDNMPHSSISGAVCKAGNNAGLDVQLDVWQFLHLSTIKNAYWALQLEESSVLEYFLHFSSVVALGIQGAMLSFASSSRVRYKSNHGSQHGWTELFCCLVCPKPFSKPPVGCKKCQHEGFSPRKGKELCERAEKN